jgi:2-aminoadipate transaminase
MTNLTPWHLARRTERMNSSIVREILKLTEQPHIISLAGGLPSPQTFPVEAIRQACEVVLGHAPVGALQYAPSEGLPALREWVVQSLRLRGMVLDDSQVLITTGSQQGLDLVGKVLIDPDSVVAVEAPSFLGALQTFGVYEARFISLPCDDEGPVVASLAQAQGARFFYSIPNFQNPTGGCTSALRRVALAHEAQRLGLPLIEDNPYGELWYDAEPPAPMASHWPDGVVYLGSFSKILAPGLRLGYVVAPPSLMPKLIQAKQGADLHTPILNQRVLYEIIRTGFLEQHIPTIRTRYRLQRDAMANALSAYMPQGCQWSVPSGGMFFWVQLPQHVDALALLPVAIEHGVAYVPGAPFYADHPAPNTLRLSFVTVDAQKIDQGVRALAAALKTIG